MNTTETNSPLKPGIAGNDRRSFVEDVLAMGYFLLSAAGSFRSRKMQLWQVVFSKNGIIGGYTPIR